MTVFDFLANVLCYIQSRVYIYISIYIYIYIDSGPRRVAASLVLTILSNAGSSV